MTISETRELVREVNNALREASAGADGVAFFCECGEPTCFRSVWLSPFRFDQARIDGVPLLGDHELQLAA